jgi:hypothetical protein
MSLVYFTDLIANWIQKRPFHYTRQQPSLSLPIFINAGGIILRTGATPTPFRSTRTTEKGAKSYKNTTGMRSDTDWIWRAAPYPEIRYQITRRYDMTTRKKKAISLSMVPNLLYSAVTIYMRGDLLFHWNLVGHLLDCTVSNPFTPPSPIMYGVQTSDRWATVILRTVGSHT